MYDFNNISFFRCFFITCVSLGIYMLCSVFPNLATAQIILEEQTYQSNVPIGDWNDPNSWLVWQSGSWEAATVPPNRNNDVFINQGHEIRLRGNEEVRNLYLFSAADPGRKINLQTFDLDVYGALRCFRIQDSDFVLHNLANALTNWIYPVTGSIVFKGLSRTVVDRISWSGQTFNSSYIVRFNPDPGETLIVNAAFKASQFILESGTVFQTLNQNGIPASSTFSFNTHSSFGDGAYGSLIIRSGARLISETTQEFGQIIRRSDSRPAAEFILEEGGILELWGDRPVIDAASVILNGEVRYVSDRPSQEFLSHTFVTSQPIVTYNDLQITGSAVRTMPPILEVSGDFAASYGTLQDNTTSLFLLGSKDQVVDVAYLPASHLEINKSGGILTFIQPLQLLGDFTMRNGTVDFNNQTLQINNTPTANYTYINGVWANLSEVSLTNLPTDLTSSNATFPFFDSFAGEKRTLTLLGTLTNSTGSLTVQHIEIPGVGYNANLTDSDGVTIYHHLNSHFLIGTNNSSTESIDIQILANDMILEGIEDLRISGYGEIAPGSHEEATMLDVNLWANRSASLSELNGRTLTLASSSEFSILPIGWISYDAEFLDNRVRVSWRVKAEAGTNFVIYRSVGPGLQFLPIGSVESNNPSTEYLSFDFIDNFRNDQNTGLVYYQIRAEMDGILVDESSVFRLKNPKISFDRLQIFPNPYFGGNLTLSLPVELETDDMTVQVIDGRGGVCLQINQFSYADIGRIEDKLTELPRGVYIIRLIRREGIQQVKWLRE